MVVSDGPVLCFSRNCKMHLHLPTPPHQHPSLASLLEQALGSQRQVVCVERESSWATARRTSNESRALPSSRASLATAEHMQRLAHVASDGSQNPERQEGGRFGTEHCANCILPVSTFGETLSQGIQLPGEAVPSVLH